MISSSSRLLKNAGDRLLARAARKGVLVFRVDYRATTAREWSCQFRASDRATTAREWSCRGVFQYRVAIFLLGLCLAATNALALDPALLRPQGYVSDFAQVLDQSSKTQLERYCGLLEESTAVQTAVVTINSLEGEPIEDFANDLFRKWAIGKKGKDEGVLLLLAIKDRKSRVEVGYGLEPILPDGFAGSVLREMTPSLKEQNYGQALLGGAAEIGDQIAKAKGIKLDRSLPRRAPPTASPQDNGIPWPLIIFGALILFGFLGRGGGSGGLLGWMVLGNLLGGSRYRGDNSSWGGGGFGGSGGGGGGGGGGGFGGFGGGDSGGGGASGSW